MASIDTQKRCEFSAYPCSNETLADQVGKDMTTSTVGIGMNVQYPKSSVRTGTRPSYYYYMNTLANVCE